MVEYMAYGTFTDKDTGRLLISRNIVAAIEDVIANGHYEAETFLDNFKRDVFPAFEYSQWEINKARTIINTGFSAELEQLFKDELSTKHNDYVYFVDGDKPSKAKMKVEREMIKQHAIADTLRAENNDAKMLMDYLNNLPINKFSAAINRNINDAYAKAARLPMKEETMYHQIALLRSIEDHAQPLYHPSEEQRTVRIFTYNESMLLLKKEIRKVLTRDWFEFDLQSAHLAIFAYMFDITEVNDFLRSGDDIWSSLFNHFGIEPSKEVKAIFKKALYSTVYGMPVRNLKGNITYELKEFGISNGGSIFVAHPIITALLDARDKAIDAIVSAGYYTTIYGKKLLTSDYSVESILSQAAQAIELKVLMPVFHLAADNESYITITLWMHDGFSISINDNEEYWISKIQKVVQDEIDRLGIVSRLVRDI